MFNDDDDVNPEHVRIEWLYDKRIVKCTLFDPSRESIDTMTDALVTIYRHWPDGKPFLALYDFSHGGILMTPYFRQRGNDLIEAASHLSGRYAVVLDDTLAGHAFAFFVKRILTYSLPNLENGVFYALDNAVAWLLV
jgi:hypothetical protein